MRSVYFAAAAALGFALLGNFACGTDNQSSPNQTNVPQTSVCPNPKIHPLAVATEDLVPKQLPAMTIALTFDSGPSESTATLEQYLAQEQVHATFFVTGQNVTGLESTLSQTATDGHLLANRGNTDDDMSKAASNDVVQSITATDALIASLVPAGKFYFRPPYGGWSAAAGTAVAASPMSKYTGPVAWDIGNDLDATASSDSDCFAPDPPNTPKTAQECGDLYLAQIRAKKKGIVLMHDGPPDTTGAETAAMVQYMVPILKNEGYKFARMDEVELVPESTLETGDDDTGGSDYDGGPSDPPPPPSDDPCVNQK